jgi:hypothetical protein
MLPAMAEMVREGRAAAFFFLLRWSLGNSLLPRLAKNQDPPDLSLLV